MKKLKIKDSSKLWFTSDMHFGHKRIIKLCNRTTGKAITEPTAAGARGSIQEGERLFKDQYEMNEELIKRWNAEISMEDTVVDLGDFMFRLPKDEAKPLLKMLNFKHIIFLKGNHGREYYQFFENIGRKVTVVEEADLLHLVIDDSEFDNGYCDIICCHYPLVEWPLRFKGALHLYGHTHRDHPEEQQGSLHVGIDTNNLKPVHYEIALTKIYLKNAKDKL